MYVGFGQHWDWINVPSWDWIKVPSKERIEYPLTSRTIESRFYARYSRNVVNVICSDLGSYCMTHTSVSYYPFKPRIDNCSWYFWEVFGLEF